jgi:hypothetical protein
VPHPYRNVHIRLSIMLFFNLRAKSRAERERERERESHVCNVHAKLGQLLCEPTLEVDFQMGGCS